MKKIYLQQRTDICFIVFLKVLIKVLKLNFLYILF